MTSGMCRAIYAPTSPPPCSGTRGWTRRTINVARVPQKHGVDAAISSCSEAQYAHIEVLLLHGTDGSSDAALAREIWNAETSDRFHMHHIWNVRS